MVIPPSERAILLVLGRSNRDRTSAQIDALIDGLRRAGMTVHGDDFVRDVRRPVTKAGARRAAAVLLSGAVQGVRWVLHGPRSLAMRPFRFAPWGLDALSQDAVAVRSRARRVRRVIADLGPEARVFILAHSAGGRVAAELGGCETVRAVACLGYPFRHPERREEPARTRALRDLRLPFLILQGRSDPYGGEDVLTRYCLSPSVSVVFVDSDHDYDRLAPDDLARVRSRVLAHFGLAAPGDGAGQSSQECSGPSNGNFFA